MDYTLDSYGSFENEQRELEAESNKKEELDRQQQLEQKEIEFRLKSISGYFLRFSWYHKKQFILSVVKNLNCLDSLLRIISYISISYGKMSAYTDVSPQTKQASQQITVDHDRALEPDCLKRTVCDDLNWLASVSYARQIILIIHLLRMAGGGLLKKVYVPIVNIYNRKVAEVDLLKAQNLTTKSELLDIINTPEPSDSDKYPCDHPLTIEVEKLRKKWNETIDKYRREVFKTEKQALSKIKEETPEKKSKLTGQGKAEKNGKEKEKAAKREPKAGKRDTESVDNVQKLPIWIVKKILDYFDQKTLQNLKRVNAYWAYACDSLLKDRQTREFLNEAIDKMILNVDPEILKQCRESEGFIAQMQPRPDSPREKRLKKLTNRGAALEKIRPLVTKSKQTNTCLVTSIDKGSEICDPIDKLAVFPRLIKDDLLLYKRYPCILKDVNILIDVEESLKKQRDTLSYSLSQQLSDTFSMSEANLADW